MDDSTQAHQTTEKSSAHFAAALELLVRLKDTTFCDFLCRAGFEIVGQSDGSPRACVRRYPCADASVAEEGALSNDRAARLALTAYLNSQAITPQQKKRLTDKLILFCDVTPTYDVATKFYDFKEAAYAPSPTTPSEVYCA